MSYYLAGVGHGFFVCINSDSVLGVHFQLLIGFLMNKG